MKRTLLVLLYLLLPSAAAVAATNRCAICGIEFKDMVYLVTDKVTEEKQSVCPECVELPHNCFLCSMPVRENYTELPDGRFLCARDARTAVLDRKEAERIVADVVDAMDRLFSRFATFSHTNVETEVIDRVTLQALFRIPGNDFACPNVLGYYQPQTNHGAVTHRISLLSGLPRAEFKAVIAHEFSHAWVFDYVPAARKESLGQDAQEGFCELVAYLLMGSQQESDEQKQVLRNRYTRGQIDLFVEAERRFGFNDVLDWMRYGVDSELSADDLTRIRKVEMRAVNSRTNTVKAVPFARAVDIPGPSRLILKGITYDAGKPLAIINDHTFAVNESAKVRIGSTNVLIQCLAIGKDRVRVVVVPTGKQEELSLPEF